ncbi:MAG: hypothetical protein U0Z53_29480 [Blastocatellia bacterium]
MMRTELLLCHKKITNEVIEAGLLFSYSPAADPLAIVPGDERPDPADKKSNDENNMVRQALRSF